MSQRAPDWARLFRIACSLIDQVNAKQAIIDQWTFGGGTALMLQIDHRESHDVDIFLPDPQLLAFLDPKSNDFRFELEPSDCTGDGTTFLKFAFEGIGEIDFIVANALTDAPTTKQTIEGEDVQLETVAEVIVKKVHYRGSTIKPRDIFDIAAAGANNREAIITALKPYKDDVEATLHAIDRLNPDFVKATIATLAIKEQCKPLVETALESAKEILRSVLVAT